jgi:hypothetical protein
MHGLWQMSSFVTKHGFIFMNYKVRQKTMLCKKNHQHKECKVCHFRFNSGSRFSGSILYSGEIVQGKSSKTIENEDLQ